MVAGKVKLAMGLQKHESEPKPKQYIHRPSSPNPGLVTKTPSKVFSRSFGVYFPRTSSAQVQPRARDITELVHLVEDLRDRESRLKTELLQQKLLNESATIVPFLEGEIEEKSVEIGKMEKVVDESRKKNEKLKLEVQCLMSLECEIQNRDVLIDELKKKVADLEKENEKLKLKNEENEKRVGGSVSSRFQGLGIVVGVGVGEGSSSRLGMQQKSTSFNKKALKPIEIGIGIGNGNSESKREEAENVCPQLSRCNSLDEYSEFSDVVVKCRVPRVPVPPPMPSLKVKSPLPSPTSSSGSSSSSSSLSSSSCGSSHCSVPSPPSRPPSLVRARAPPPPPPPMARGKNATPPMGKTVPPPPPLPVKGARLVTTKVKRVPEVVEFYNSLMHHRDPKRDSGIGASESSTNGNARDMIGEIENRSAHLIAIKMDVETQGDFIRFLIKEVENAAFTNITDVVSFVKWLDDELSYLVDERAVLKHFDWPESKADALREAAFGYCDIKKLETDASSMMDNIREPCSSALKKMQVLLEKLEQGVYNLSRMRESESASKKSKGFSIPTDWMLETGLANQIKLASVKLAMMYMKRISAELTAVGSGHETEELMLQGVRFAFRVHQFAGGFDVETMHAFQELRNKAGSRL